MLSVNGGDACALAQTHTAGQTDSCTQYWVPAGGTLASGETKTLSPDLAGLRITYPGPRDYRASLSPSANRCSSQPSKRTRVPAAGRSTGR
ncbi:hypothetical protein [Sorangium sp. So ce887]|uniref:hypothetical protein n=1 Tax=Sorangium sp. So ce887 TaxID=3133324 RepID=UPI003F60BABF